MKTRRHFLKYLLGLTVFSAAAQSIFAGVQPILATVQRFLSRAHPKKGATGKARAVRCWDIERGMLEQLQKSSIGVQFGGKVYNLYTKVILLPLLGANGPVGIDGRTPADRRIKAETYRDWLGTRKLEDDPRFSRRLLPRDSGEADDVPFDLDRPLKEILTELFECPKGTWLSLSGTLIVACDTTSWDLKQRLDEKEDLPQYFKDHPICYAGRGKTLQGLPSGSTMPNPADHLPDKVELGECEELGMEGIWKIDVVSLPAIFWVNDERNEFKLMICKHKFRYV